MPLMKSAITVTDLAAASFFVGSAIILIVRSWPALPQSLMKHGKVLAEYKNGPNRAIFDYVMHWSVSKAYFVLFYAFGVVSGFYTYYTRSVHPVVFILFQVHLLRRFLECARDNYRLKNEKRGEMHVVHFVIGELYYPGVWTIYSQSADNSWTNASVYEMIPWILLFCTAQVLQYQTHLDLLQSRKLSSSVSSSYGLPSTFWFRYAACPHYFAEWCIHGSLSMLAWITFSSAHESSHGFALASHGLWLISCLGSVAIDTHRWYIDQFHVKTNEENASTAWIYKRARVVPFVW